MKNPLSSIAPSIEISTFTSGGNQIDEITSGYNPTISSAAPLDIDFFSPTGTQIVGSSVTLVIRITTTYQYSTGGFFEIEAPSGLFTWTTSQCNAAVGFASAGSCSIYNTNKFRLAATMENNSAGASKSYTIVIGALNLPYAAITADSLIVYLKDSNGGDGVTISSATTGMALTMGGGAIEATISRSDNAVAATGVTYTIEMTADNVVPDGGIYRIVIPNEMISTSGSPSCTTTTGSTITCPISSSGGYTTLRVTEWCTNSCQAGVTRKMRIINAVNPTAAVGTYSESVTISTLNVYNSIDYVIDTVTSSVQPDLLETNPLAASAATKNAVTGTGDDVEWAFDFTTVSEIPSGGYVRIYFPAGVAYRGSGTI